jgi:hypothetical protein
MNDWQLWNFGIRKHGGREAIRFLPLDSRINTLVKVALNDLIDGKVTEEEKNLSNRK